MRYGNPYRCSKLRVQSGRDALSGKFLRRVFFTLLQFGYALASFKVLFGGHAIFIFLIYVLCVSGFPNNENNPIT